VAEFNEKHGHEGDCDKDGPEVFSNAPHEQSFYRPRVEIINSFGKIFGKICSWG
jgi:hypothetical protein